MDGDLQQPFMDMGEPEEHPSNTDQPASTDLNPTINTGGGAAVFGPVSVQGGDFVGRDKILITEEASYDVRGLPNPYLGLRAFTYKDRSAFGGREQAVQEAVAKLTQPEAQQVVLFITGASGSGKSSFAQAGLLPALEVYYREHRKQVLRAIFRPSSDPLAMLADALGLLGLPELSSIELSRFTPEEFAHFLSEHTPKEQVNLLVIDQFEELFTQSAAGQRDTLFGFLACLLPFDEVHTHFLVTLRSDFLDELFDYKKLWDIAKRGLELRAMSLVELKQAVQQPLWTASPQEADQRRRFEAALLDRLAQDAGQDATYLPLLQVTLQELWNGGSLTLDRYSTLTDAIRRRAETVYRYEDFEASQPEKERSQEDREAILRIFLDLVNVSLDDDPRRDVRRPRNNSELTSDSGQRQHLIAQLIQARLLSVREETQGEAQVEIVDIIHESLITNWDRLREAVAGRRQMLHQRARFEQQLAEWLGSERSDEYVLTGVHLAEGRELERRDDVALRGAKAKALLQRSNELTEAVQRQRVRNVIYVAVSLSVALLIAILAAGVAIWRSDQLANEKSTSEARRVAAEYANATANAERSTSEARSLIAQEAEGTADSERSIAEAAKSTAEAQAEISLERQLSAQVQELLLSRSILLPRALLLSVEALRRYPERAASQALANALQKIARPIARMPHHSSVTSVTFSPDGKWVASGSADGTARVWEAASGQEVTRMIHGDGVTSVAFSPDGKWVVSGSYDGTARVWEAATGQEVARMTHDDWVYSVAFSPDGKWVISGSYDGTARVWEAASGHEIARMTHSDGVDSVAFSPDGKWVASGSADGTARVWEAASGQEVARMTHSDVVDSVAFSPDGKWVVSGSLDKTARVWEAASGHEIARMTYDNVVTSVAFSPDGRWVVSGNGDGTARVWEAASGQEVDLMTHDDMVDSVAFSPDGRWVVSGGADGTAWVWEAASGQEVSRMTHDGGVDSVAFSPDGKWVVSGSYDGTARVWEAASGEEVARMTHDDVVDSVAFSPDGKWVVSSSWDKTARVWEAASGHEIARMTHGDVVDSVAFSPDGKWVVSGSIDGTARVWEAASGHEIARMTHDGGVDSVAFSPDGRRAVSGSLDGTARVWETASGHEIARMNLESWVTSVAFSPDGRWVVSGSLHGTARVWEAASGREVARWTYGDDGVTSIAFSPDGKWVVSGSFDGTARVLEAASGHEIARMTHDSVVTSVAFSPDGKWVASGSYDGTARVWKAASGQEVARITEGDVVESVAFSPDGNWVASGSEDGTAWVWLWQPEDLIDLACARLDRNLTQAEWQQYLGEQPYRQTCPNLPPGK